MNDKPITDDDELRDHYNFDFSRAKPNRYAALFGPLKPGGRVVYLDPEVAERFQTSEVVNRVLKALLKVMPRSKGIRKQPPAKARVSKTTKTPIARTGLLPEFWKNWDEVFGSSSERSSTGRKTTSKSIVAQNLAADKSTTRPPKKVKRPKKTR